MGQLNLGHGESGEGCRQQPGLLPIEMTGDQVNQVDSEGVGYGHEEAAHIGEARRPVEGIQGLHSLRRGTKPLRHGRQTVPQVCRDGQQIEREVAVGIAAPMLAMEVPERVESGFAGVQSR